MYILGDERGNNREAFDVLEGAFGAREFEASEAAAVLQSSLELSELEASRLVRRLIESDVIQEA